MQEAESDQQQGRLVAVQLHRRQPAACADAQASVGFVDVDAGAVAQRRHVTLHGSLVDLQLIGQLLGGHARLGLAETREKLDDTEELLAGLVGHETGA